MIGRVTELACYRKVLVALWAGSERRNFTCEGRPRYFRVFTYSAMALACSSVRPEIPFLCGGLLSRMAAQHPYQQYDSGILARRRPRLPYIAMFVIAHLLFCVLQ
jgi:hypothetical protein